MVKFELWNLTEEMSIESRNNHIYESYYGAVIELSRQALVRTNITTG